MDDDIILEQCNETELLQLAHRQGLGTLRRGLDHQELVAIVAGVISPESRHLSDSTWTRAKLEATIFANWDQLMSQLPGCTGKCSIYPCTEGKHAQCFEPNQEMVRR